MTLSGALCSASVVLSTAVRPDQNTKSDEWSRRAQVLKEKVKKILRDARGTPSEIHLVDVIKRVVPAAAEFQHGGVALHGFLQERDGDLREMTLPTSGLPPSCPFVQTSVYAIQSLDHLERGIYVVLLVQLQYFDSNPQKIKILQLSPKSPRSIDRALTQRRYIYDACITGLIKQQVMIYHCKKLIQLTALLRASRSEGIWPADRKSSVAISIPMALSPRTLLCPAAHPPGNYSCKIGDCVTRGSISAFCMGTLFRRLCSRHGGKDFLN
ncbi:hypothetical protein H6P81_007091 [Aristolochia fimbriata]|uniref:Uncharacterized protein n=1 Tax=Aristolochia fimbriata TaxID=158543 RepID=A0AAV7F313_ARIFI|nr:hypothetical protein H6P81_007091 [Aristolochia fimbriata]